MTNRKMRPAIGFAGMFCLALSLGSCSQKTTEQDARVSQPHPMAQGTPAVRLAESAHPITQVASPPEKRETAKKKTKPKKIRKKKKRELKKKPRLKENIIVWSGYKWIVEDWKERVIGPGPHKYSASEEAVWVDSKDRLHVKLTQKDGEWYGATIMTEKTLGYGKYKIHMDSRLDQFSDNTTFAFWTWDWKTPQKYSREIDYEFSRWGRPENLNSQMVVQPWDAESDTNWSRYDIGSDPKTSHAWDWKPDRILFESRKRNGKLIHGWAYRGDNIPDTNTEQVRISIWMYKAKPPEPGTSIEAIVEKFVFKPHKKVKKKNKPRRR